MKLKITLFIVIFLQCFFLAAQSPGLHWAGPDTTTCGEKGVALGINNACPGCCYKWFPTENLSCTDCPNPIAKPHHTTTYKVTVVSQNLSWIEEDEVLVDLSFGQIEFDPAFLTQGTNKLVTATLIHNASGTNNISWSFDGDDLQCSIVSQNGATASIIPGNKYGHVTVKVINQDVPGCEYKEKIDVNNGVKDVWASDLQHPSRVAKNGQTLYIVGHGDVEIKAIPNEGGFENGNPKWQSDSNKPQDGQVTAVLTEMSLPYPGNSSYYGAGSPPQLEPKVDVVRLFPVSVGYGNNLAQALGSVSQMIKSYLKFANAEPSSYSPCGSSTPLTVEFALQYLNFTQTQVEKYNSPDFGHKLSLSCSASFNVSGNLNHPVYTRNFFLPPPFDLTVCTVLGLTASANLSLNLSATKDPSQQDSTWNFDNPSVSLAFCAGGGISGYVNNSAYQLIVSANFTFCLKPTIFFDLPSKALKFKVSADPASVTVVAKVVSLADIAKVKDLFHLPSGTVQILKSFETDPITIYQF